MKKQSRTKKITTLIILVASMMASSVATAGLINSDFSSGLDAWGGDVQVYNYDNDTSEWALDIDFADYADNFSVAADAVTLTTSFDAENDFWGAYLYQSFVVNSDAQTLSLDFSADADYSFVTLVDDNWNLIHDFASDGLSFDISAWVGSTVSLEFGVEDEDFNLGDTLTVSNINLTRAAAEVSEPETVLLFLAGLFAIRRQSAKTNRAKTLNA